MNRELLESLYEYALSLKGEWAWKQGERAGNAEEYKELLETIRQAEERLANPEPEPVADMKRLSDDEILKLKNPSMFVSSALSFARAIESALLEKNAQNKAVIKLEPSSEDLMNFSKYPKCNRRLIAEGKPNPRTCAECGLGPCKAIIE